MHVVVLAWGCCCFYFSFLFLLLFVIVVVVVAIVVVVLGWFAGAQLHASVVHSHSISFGRNGFFAMHRHDLSDHPLSLAFAFQV